MRESDYKIKNNEDKYHGGRTQASQTILGSFKYARFGDADGNRK